jgi:hypothetical protein
MNMKTIALALCAIGAGTAATSAFAVDRTRTLAAMSAGRVVYATGATAPTKIVYAAVRRLCDVNTSSGNTIDIYKAGTVVGDPGDTSYGNSFSYSCRLKSTLTDPNGSAIAWAGQDAVISFAVSGGSFSSVLAMSTDTNRQNSFVRTDLLGCATTASTTLTSFGDKTYTGCSANARVRSQGGFSDVEAALFADLLAGVPGVGAADVEVSQTFAAQTFALAATEGLYRALQAAQGLPAGCQDDNLLTGVVVGANDRSPACQPSISRQTYASIVNNDPFSVTRNDWSFVIPGSANPVVVCRRPASSGTQASSNAFFLNTPCGRGPLTFGERVPAGAADSALPGYNVIENSGSSDVRNCVNSTTNFGIGVLSGENAPVANTDRYAFVKIDGVAVNEDAKNRQSAIDGRYEFAYELVLHTNRNASVTPSVPGQLLKTLASNLGDPSLADLTGLFQVAAGGFTGPTVSRATRGGNSCSPWAY